MATTMKMRNGKMTAIDGPFMETSKMLDGLVVIESRNLKPAVQIAEGMPHAQSMYVEVRSAIAFSKPRLVHASDLHAPGLSCGFYREDRRVHHTEPASGRV